VNHELVMPARCDVVIAATTACIAPAAARWAGAFAPVGWARGSSRFNVARRPPASQRLIGAANVAISWEEVARTPEAAPGENIAALRRCDMLL